jgi:hypothetical protein
MRDHLESIEKFLQTSGYEFNISSSVKKETEETLDKIYTWLQNDIKEHFSAFLHKQEAKGITRKDILLFEPFFEERRNELKGTPAYFFLITEHIEHWLVEYIKAIPYGKTVEFDVFLSTLSREINEVYEALLSKIEAFEEKDISPQPSLRTYLLLHGIRQERDQDHLASVIQFQYESDCWVVFVTIDRKTILQHRKNLMHNCALHCSKPDYAKERLEQLSSKGESPMQFFRNLQETSQKQREFAEFLEKAIDIRLIDDK